MNDHAMAGLPCRVLYLTAFLFASICGSLPAMAASANESLLWHDVSQLDDLADQRLDTSYQTQGTTPVYDSYHNLKRHAFEMGLEFSAIKYEEPNFMEDEGEMYGISARYTHRSVFNENARTLGDAMRDPNKINMYRLEAKYSFGEVDYSSQGTGTIDDIEDHMFEARGIFGYDFQASSSWLITPYAGFGYRYLNDDSGGMRSTTGHYGYERESNYFYIPLGVETTTVLQDGWSLGLNLEYDLFVGGKQESHLEDVSSGYSTVKNDQNKGYGFRGSVRLMKNTGTLSLFLEPFFRYWHIDDSDISAITYGGTITGYGLEPENTSQEYGIKAGINF